MLRRIAFAMGSLFCAAVVAVGVHLALQQQRQIEKFSASTTATVLGKRVERRKGGSGIRKPDESRYSYKPVVHYRFEVEGRQITSENVFPSTSWIGGNIAWLQASATLERLAGPETIAHYNPADPAESCLIRRPAVLPYLVAVLLPIALLCGLLARLWRPKKHKAGWIAAFWYLAGLTSAAHYFYLSGADYGGDALMVFGLYMQVGLTPLAVALSASESSTARRVRSAIMLSLIGAFLGFWLGLLIGWLSGWFGAGAGFRLSCWGYGTAVPAAILFVVGASRRSA